jgi:hypothetical protein
MYLGSLGRMVGAVVSTARFAAGEVVFGTTTTSGLCELEGGMVVVAEGAAVVLPDATGQVIPPNAGVGVEEEGRVDVGNGVVLSGGDDTAAAELEAGILLPGGGAGALGDALEEAAGALSVG